MYKLTIGIPTYKRPIMLEKLLHSILSSHVDSSLLSYIDIVVVDNDAERTAEAVVAHWINNHPDSFFHLHYFNYPIKGLANVRNEILKRALILEPDYIAFIDDDEYACPDWMNELTFTIVNNQADIVVGPVLPIFEQETSPAISSAFYFFRYNDQEAIDFMYSGNVIMRARFLIDQQLIFDARFNTLGAEDTFFGVTALKKGAKIFWSNKAVAYEVVPEKRAKLSWLIKRKFRLANTYMYILLIEKQYGKIIKKVLVSFFFLFVGTLALILTPMGIKHRFFGILKISESLGALAKLFNINYQEYL